MLQRCVDIFGLVSWIFSWFMYVSRVGSAFYCRSSMLEIRDTSNAEVLIKGCLTMLRIVNCALAAVSISGFISQFVVFNSQGFVSLFSSMVVEFRGLLYVIGFLSVVFAPIFICCICFIVIVVSLAMMAMLSCSVNTFSILGESMRRRITTRVVSLVRSEPWTERIFPTTSIVEQSNHDWRLISGAPVMTSSIMVGNPRSRGGQRLCSDYYDQDGETRRLSDGRRERRFEELETRERHFLEDGQNYEESMSFVEMQIGFIKDENHIYRVYRGATNQEHL
ncbi:hypothetical protein F2Q68_00009088 [Brassica cretica]|uniref:Uncharacterized protein n=1 Tax=Brassica cretica TaxID=69181 RepID=A0A8S9L1S0_BRACR|nr:hypothetical protein F2Q68_00009088 [Brassica cretica]